MSPGLLKVGAALVLTSPFVPMLFQGEEWGATTPFLYFTDHQDPELGRAVGEGRRREFEAFGWDPTDIPDPQERRTFDRSKLEWAEIDDPGHADLLEWHRSLIRLRRSTPALSDGRRDLVETGHGDDGRWLVVRRGPVTVACNLSPIAAEVALDPDRTGRILLSSAKEPVVNGGIVRLEPESVTIFS